MIDLTQIARHTLQTHPYAWAEIGHLFSAKDAASLASSYPHDHCKRVVGYGGEKDYEYEARALIGMGAEIVSHPEELSQSWLKLAQDLLSPAYRTVMSLLTGRDLTILPMEVNVLHYGQGGSMGPHPDLPDKLVTHILYFNPVWDKQYGGCLNILGSADMADSAAEIVPLVGNSVVLVRSDHSWHAVSRVAADCPWSRRSLTVTFYRHGALSTMWPPDDLTPLRPYGAADQELAARRPAPSRTSWRRRLAAWMK
jgi:SM-20-related protein